MTKVEETEACCGGSNAVNQRAISSEATCCARSHQATDTNTPYPCGPEAGSPRAAGTLGAKRRVDIDFLYLDLDVCERCQDTDSWLEEAIVEIVRVLEATGVQVALNKTHVTSEEQSTALGFLVSPTIRVNGRDIQVDFTESLCESCGTLCECEGGVSCRDWEYQGQWYTAPPKGLIIEAILSQVYRGGDAKDGAAKPILASDNLKRFFSGRSKDQATLSGRI